MVVGKASWLSLSMILALLMWSYMYPHCLATIRTFRGIPHHSRLNARTFPGLSPDNPQTVLVLSGESVNRTLFPRLTRMVRRNGIIHFGNASCSCPCSRGHQASGSTVDCISQTHTYGDIIKTSHFVHVMNIWYFGENSYLSHLINIHHMFPTCYQSHSIQIVSLKKVSKEMTLQI